MFSSANISLEEALAIVAEGVGQERASEELLQKLRWGEVTAVAERVITLEFTGSILYPRREIGSEDRNIAIPPTFWIEPNLKIDWERSAARSPDRYISKLRTRSPEEIIATGIHLSRSDIEAIWSELEPTESQDANAPGYITPFIKLMLEAIEHFNISPSGRNPKKDELVAWFMQKTLPNGTPISKNQAENMATFSRPPEMAKGGNSKV